MFLVDTQNVASCTGDQRRPWKTGEMLQGQISRCQRCLRSLASTRDTHAWPNEKRILNSPGMRTLRSPKAKNTAGRPSISGVKEAPVTSCPTIVVTCSPSLPMRDTMSARRNISSCPSAGGSSRSNKAVVQMKKGSRSALQSQSKGEHLARELLAPRVISRLTIRLARALDPPRRPAAAGRRLAVKERGQMQSARGQQRDLELAAALTRGHNACQKHLEKWDKNCSVMAGALPVRLVCCINVVQVCGSACC